MTRLCIVGLGNMGNAILGGVLDSKVLPKEAVIGVEKVKTQAERVAQARGISVYQDFSCIAKEDVVLLAVKPQQMPDMLDALEPYIDGNLLISIAAGISTSMIVSVLHNARVVRCMPNMPALVRRGMTGIYASSAVSADDRQFATKVLSSIGAILWMDKEDDIDRVTALSGSGPAYVYYFLEALEDAGVLIGLSRENSRKLAAETIEGSIELLKKTGEHPTVMKERVTSPGGTTIHALSELEKAGVKGTIQETVLAAYLRSLELGQTGDRK